MTTTRVFYMALCHLLLTAFWWKLTRLILLEVPKIELHSCNLYSLLRLQTMTNKCVQGKMAQKSVSNSLLNLRYILDNKSYCIQSKCEAWQICELPCNLSSSQQTKFHPELQVRMKLDPSKRHLTFTVAFSLCFFSSYLVYHMQTCIISSCLIVHSF